MQVRDGSAKAHSSTIMRNTNRKVTSGDSPLKNLSVDYRRRERIFDGVYHADSDDSVDFLRVKLACFFHGAAENMIVTAH